MLKVAKIAGALFLIGSAAPAPATAAPPAPEPAPDCRPNTGHIERGKRLCVTAPDGDRRLIVDRNWITFVEDDESNPIKAADHGYIEWSPNSDGFVIVEEDGMGVSYFDLRSRPPRRDRRASLIATAQYAKSFNCVGPDAKAYALYSGWQDGERLRFVVQESAKSQGCPPRDPGNALIGVLINPRTNHIDEVVDQARVSGEWCAERRPYSQCHVRPRYR